MEDENIVENTPVETISSDENFFDDIADDILANREEDTTKADGVENQNETDEDVDDGNVDYKPLLEELSKKIKYNKENVSVESIDDVINNYQKGLNYDKLQDKLTNLENGNVMQYMNKKATELGMSVDEYMEQIEAYEKEKEEEAKALELEKMIDNGIPEEYAKEIIASRELRKQLQEEKNKQEQERKQREEEAKKNKEYEDFISRFPNVDAKTIPKEVFENAKTLGLTTAYVMYQNEELSKKLNIKDTNEKNKNSNIGSTTESGNTNQEVNDLFLDGFNSY